MRRSLLLLLAIAAAVASSCVTPDVETVDLGGDRPTGLFVPVSYEQGTPTPLLLTLHGYGSNGDDFVRGSGLAELAAGEGFLLLAPDGTPDRLGARFWDATEACCNFGDDPVDDVGYLTGLVEDAARQYSVDSTAVHVVGFSNGAFMAHRLACERPDLFASIVAVAGSIDPDRDCVGAGSTSVLSIHGTADQTINYEGGATYPSAPETTAAWVADLECGPGADGDSLDLDTSIPGTETVTVSHQQCRGGATVALWTVEGAGHLIAFSEDLADTLWTWLTVHASD